MCFSRFLRVTFAAALLALLPARADVTVFAAASLSDVLKEIGDAYKQDMGNAVVFSFAASSALARQIEASSGADIFISADTDWMDYLDSRGLIAHDSRVDLLGNRLVLIAPAASVSNLAPALSGVATRPSSSPSASALVRTSSSA